MNRNSTFAKQSTSCLIFVCLLSLLPVLGYLAPRVLAYMPGVFILFGIFALRGSACKKASIVACFDKGFFSVALGVTVICALSSFWAMDLEFALERSLKIGLVLIPGAILFAQMRNLKLCDLKLLPLIFSLSAIISGAFLAYDLGTQSGLYHMLNGPAQDPENVSYLNRSVVAFLFFSLLAFYLLRTDTELTFKKTMALSAALLTVLLIVLSLTDSQSAQMGFIMAVLVWFVFPARFRKAWWALGAVLVAGFFAAPWLAQSLYALCAAYVHDAGVMSEAFVAPRMEIWDMVSSKALESPFIGYGIEATRHVKSFDTQMLYTPLDHVLHPHNFAIQIWLEFGLLGIVPATILTIYILQTLYKQPEPFRKFALTVFLSIMAVASTSYGLWQGWWLGMFVLLASLSTFLQPERTGTKT